MNLRQGLTAGVIVALITSGVVGASSTGWFWSAFLVALGLSLVCVLATAGVLALIGHHRRSY